jgi:phage recombination protein Bet
MTRALEQRRPLDKTSGMRQFGDLPPATSSMDLNRALELAGIDEPELVLLASTTFKECSSMEELITLIATVRRRGLDPLLKQVYYERFGGESSGPSLHIGIDGLRTIAVKTGRYVGAGEPRFSDVYDMRVDDRGATKPVPAKCVVTVFANNGSRVGAFEGVAFMDECYPGVGPRGRMWRARPRSMLAIAAERQALRRAFPSETGGLADVDEGEQPTGPVVVERPSERETAARADDYTRMLGESVYAVDTRTGEVVQDPRAAAIVEQAHAAAQARDETVAQLNRAQLRERWGLLTGKARDLGVEYEPISQSVSDADALAAVEDLERRVRDAEAGIVKEGVI